jgi:hypothetical protein
MRYEIQVHFQNCGQLAWHEEIFDADNWLNSVMSEDRVIAQDEETNRVYAFEMKNVTALVLTEKKKEIDIWERTYAAVQGKEQEDDQQEHPGNGRKRPPPETGRGCCY